VAAVDVRTARAIGARRQDIRSPFSQSQRGRKNGKNFST